MYKNRGRKSGKGGEDNWDKARKGMYKFGTVGVCESKGKVKGTNRGVIKTGKYCRCWSH